jgi:hypothetical protein
MKGSETPFNMKITLTDINCEPAFVASNVQNALPLEDVLW